VKEEGYTTPQKFSKIIDNQEVVISSLIVILALSLRAYGLGSNSLWLDELWSLRGAQSQSTSELFSWIYSLEYSDAPAFFVIEWISFRAPLLGPEASLRLAPMFFSTATVPFVGLLARRWFDRRTAVISMLLFSVSMTQIYFAQEARPYSGMIFFTTLNTWLWLEIISPRKTTEKSNTILVLYIIFSVLGCYFDYYIILVTIAHLLSTPLLTNFRPTEFRNQFAIFGVIVLFFTPCIPKLLRDLRNSPSYPKDPEIYFFRNYQVLHFNSWELFFWISIALYSFHLYRCIMSYDRSKTIPDNAAQFLPELLFVSWLALPAILLVLISWATDPIVTTKRLLFTSPASYILLARASVEFGKLTPKLDIFPYLLASTLLAHTLFIGDYFTEPQKQPMRDGLEYLNEYSADDAVYAYPDSHFFITYEESLFENSNISWHSSYDDHDGFIEFVRENNIGWILIADNKANPFEVGSLLSEIDQSAKIVDERRWDHMDPLNEGWVSVRVLMISIG